ncbi:DUF805 domain-containing protein [uncultured Croceicoccus sp.]|uniref:DUF805 domain-containing protein n=1 Tax=uncultured Croceicoccus sp. TaxID=1295329 RepID=UPI00261E1DA1|nr:DUF805 domain-containing protein [uncultured Croceicoccus sp.]
MYYMLLPYRRYFEFDGRSRRREYWMFMLFQLIVNVALLAVMLIGAATFEAGMGATPGPFAWLAIIGWFVFAAISFVPSIAVQVRRFHDQEKTGLLVLLNLIPFGSLVVLVMMLFEGTRGPNHYGPDPKAGWTGRD